MKNFFKKTKQSLIAFLVFVFSVTLLAPASPASAAVGMQVGTGISNGVNLYYGNARNSNSGNLLLLQKDAGINSFAVDTSGNVNALGSITGSQLCIGASCQSSWPGGGASAVPGAGTAGRTLYDNGTAWTASTNIYNNGGNIGIGTTNPINKLDVRGYISGDVLNSYSSGDPLELQYNIAGDVIVHGADSNLQVQGTGNSSFAGGLSANSLSFPMGSGLYWSPPGDATSLTAVQNGGENYDVRVTLADDQGQNERFAIYTDYWNGSGSDRTTHYFSANGNAYHENNLYAGSIDTSGSVNSSGATADSLFSGYLSVGENNFCHMCTRVWIEAPDGAEADAITAVGNLYGIQTGAKEVSGIGIQSSGGSSGYDFYGSGPKTYFAGNVGIGNTSPSYMLHVSGDIYADGGWLRTNGDRGWYNESYGGGWNMTDSTWIRTYGDKNIYQNTGILRTDGELQVGPSGNRFVVNSSGNVGIGTTGPGYKLDISGNMRTTGRYYSNEWIQMDNYSGLYSPINGAHLYPNNGTYGAWRTDGTRNGYGGINYNNRTVLMMQDDLIGLYNEANGRWIMYGYGSSGNAYISPNGGSVGIGNTSPSYRLHVSGDIYADGGWLRTNGNRGWYNESYGGGWYMEDSSWIRTYGSKNIYQNTGILRTDGELQVGPSGNRFLVNSSGNVGIGTTNPDQGKLDIRLNTSLIYGISVDNGSAGTAIYGHGSTGVYGREDMEYGTGVAGLAFGDNSRGIEGINYGNGGPGVYGQGVTYGVQGATESGIAGYFESAEDWSDDPAVVGRHTGHTANYGIGVQGEGGWIGVRGIAPSDGWADFYAGGQGNYATFTGSHDVRIAKEGSDKFEQGMLVVTTGDVAKREDTLSTTLPKVTLAAKVKDSAVFGVFVQKGKQNLDWYVLKSDETLASINALGEGAMLVTNYGGEINNGDLITTSPIPGFGMKQDDDLMRSYTAAKATQSVDWSKVKDTVTFEGKTYKKVLITVTYHAG